MIVVKFFGRVVFPEEASWMPSKVMHQWGCDEALVDWLRSDVDPLRKYLKLTYLYLVPTLGILKFPPWEGSISVRSKIVERVELVEITTVGGSTWAFMMGLGTPASSTVKAWIALPCPLSPGISGSM